MIPACIARGPIPVRRLSGTTSRPRRGSGVRPPRGGSPAPAVLRLRVFLLYPRCIYPRCEWMLPPLYACILRCAGPESQADG